MSEGTVTAGGVVSVTRTAKVALPTLPWLSAAVQVTVVSPTGKASPEVRSQVAGRSPSTSSLALGSAQVTVAPDGPVASTGAGACAVTVGAVTSWTVTLKLALPVWPAVSVAEQVTFVVPKAGVQVVARAPSTLSEAVAENEYAAPAVLVASRVVSAGTATAGAVVSTTRTVNEDVAVFGTVSDEVQVTVVAPRANVEPDAGWQETMRLPSTASVAVGAA